MRRKGTSAAIIFCLLLAVSTAVAQIQTPVTTPSPVNPAASPEARALLRYMDSISGRYTLTGQHNYPNHIARWTDRAYDFTGKYPALFGQDFGFSAGDDKDSVEARPAMIEEVKRQYRNGAVITLTWHALRPTDDEPVTFMGSVRKQLTDFEWNELLTPGTEINKRWCAQVDVVAGYLKQLRDAHVPVLFRPYHEMNGNWFWWGGRGGPHGSSALYRQLYDRFVNYHHLDNLIWVWNVNAPSAAAGPFADYFPGAEYVDMPTVDNYGEFKQEYYDDILALAKDKPVALGEVGALPDLAIFKAQPRWTYFMVWSEFVEFANAADKVKAVYSAPNMLGRDDPRLAAPMAAMRKASAIETAVVPVTPDASAPAKELLTRLHSASGKSVLTGQQNDLKALSASSDHVLAVTAMSPAIYGAELGSSKNAALVINEAKRQHQKGAIVSLNWHPARPTDNDPANWEQSVRGQLTDFEWNELLTPDTHLYARWCSQVDTLAASLKQLQDAGVPVLWSPYPQSNGKEFWWAGRKGIHGSTALYRQLFDRLVNHDGLRNLVWVWNAAPPASDSDGSRYSEFFPGLVYVDALALNVNDVNSRWRSDDLLRTFAVAKPIGLELSGEVPDANVLAQQSSWSWVTLSADAVKDANRDEALRKLYASPRIAARSGAVAPVSDAK